jgi:hypothetical protein
MNWSGKAELAHTPMTNITVSGKAVAAVQNVKNLSFARVYEAGHEIVSTELISSSFGCVLIPLHFVLARLPTRSFSRDLQTGYRETTSSLCLRSSEDRSRTFLKACLPYPTSALTMPNQWKYGTTSHLRTASSSVPYSYVNCRLGWFTPSRFDRSG